MGTLKNRCVIVGGGDCSTDILKLNINCNDYIICADSGFDAVFTTGIIPDLLIGDFDSIRKIPDDVETIALPVEKDITDCEAAYLEGVKRGYKDFLILGGTGGRFEHTFANISLMARASKEGNTFSIIDEKHIFRSVTNSSLKLSFTSDKQISVFAFGRKAYGVCEKGFHYPLDNFTLDPFVPIGISNDITSDYGEIIVEDGTIIVIETQM